MAKQSNLLTGPADVALAKQASRRAKGVATPILECPPHLSPAARLEWERLVPELVSKNVLSRLDLGALAAYCTAYGLYLEAVEMVNKHGAMIKSPNGYPQQSPYLSHLNKQAEIMTRIAAEFGFTPASRTRIFSFEDRNSLLIEARPNDTNFNW